MIGLLVPLMAFLRVPEPLRRLASGIALGAALIALLFVMWAFWSRAERKDDEANIERGRETERAEQMAETIDRVEKANEAERQITASPDAARDNCVRHSRTPENCGHGLPVVPRD